MASYNADTIMLSGLEPYSKYSCSLFHVRGGVVEMLTDAVHFSTRYSSPEPPPAPRLEQTENGASPSHALHITLDPTSTKYGPVIGYELQFIVVLDIEAVAGKISRPQHHELSRPDGNRDSVSDAIRSDRPIDFAYKRFTHMSLPTRVAVGPSLLNGALKPGVTYAAVLLGYTNDTIKRHVFVSASAYSDFFTTPGSPARDKMFVKKYHSALRYVILGGALPAAVVGSLILCLVFVWRVRRRERKPQQGRQHTFRRPVLFRGPVSQGYQRVMKEDFDMEEPFKGSRAHTSSQGGYGKSGNTFSEAMRNFEKEIPEWGGKPFRQSPTPKTKYSYDGPRENIGVAPPKIIVHDASSEELVHPTPLPSQSSSPVKPPLNPDHPVFLGSLPSQSLSPVHSPENTGQSTYGGDPARNFASPRTRRLSTVATPGPARGFSELPTVIEDTSSSVEEPNDYAMVSRKPHLQDFKAPVVVHTSTPSYADSHPAGILVQSGVRKEEVARGSGHYCGAGATELSRVSGLTSGDQSSSQAWPTPPQPPAQVGHVAVNSDVCDSLPGHMQSEDSNAYNLAVMYNRQFNSAYDSSRDPDQQGSVDRETSDELIDFMSSKHSLQRSIDQRSIEQRSMEQPYTDQLSSEQPFTEQRSIKHHSNRDSPPVLPFSSPPHKSRSSSLQGEVSTPRVTPASSTASTPQDEELESTACDPNTFAVQSTEQYRPPTIPPDSEITPTGSEFESTPSNYSLLADVWSTGVDTTDDERKNNY